MAGFAFALRTFGCQMNVADDDALARELAARGGVQVSDANAADLIIVNTCVVRKKAEDKAFSFVGALRPLTEGRPTAQPVNLNAPKLTAQGDVPSRMRERPAIVVVGCLVPKSGAELTRKFGFVDAVAATSEPSEVIAAIEAVMPLPPRNENAAQARLEHVGEALPESCTAAAGDDSVALSTRQSGLVTVQRGCSHGCSFCIVPSVRGPEASVPVERIVDEVNFYHARGFNEVTLLGQNILSYGSDRGFSPDFVEMMEAVLAQTEVPWVSFLTSQPHDMSDEIVRRVIAHPRVTPLLHLPVQAGSDAVLQRMRRGYTVAEYERWVEKARAARPDVFLTTDFICGFPGETDGDFARTLALVERVRFNDAFMFAYSPREGTAAAELDGEVLLAERKRRLNELIALQRRIAQEVNAKYVEQVLDAIVEEAGAQRAVARTAFNKPVVLPRTHRASGEFTQVRVTEVVVSSFKGEEVEP
jgi:tRNA-2-methylthio-N6-dimethylallyladenosine synthase